MDKPKEYLGPNSLSELATIVKTEFSSSEGGDGKPGQDGFSPTIDLTPIDNGTKVTITDINGEKTFDIFNGENGRDGEPGVDGAQGPKGTTGDKGADGYSPTVEVTPIDAGHKVSITDVNGTKEFDVLNGKDGTSTVVTPTIETPNKALTSAEYEALSDAEKQADVAYIITDDNEESGGSGGTSEDIYSTEEVRIGRWIDGKPLYRKVINATTPSTKDSWSSVAPPIKNAIVVMFHSYITNAYNEIFDTVFTGPAGSILLKYSNATGSLFYTQNSDFINRPIILILEYTKTTDQPEVTA